MNKSYPTFRRASWWPGGERASPLVGRLWVLIPGLPVLQLRYSLSEVSSPHTVPEQCASGWPLCDKNGHFILYSYLTRCSCLTGFRNKLRSSFPSNPENETSELLQLQYITITALPVTLTHIILSLSKIPVTKRRIKEKLNTMFFFTDVILLSTVLHKKACTFL